MSIANVLDYKKAQADGVQQNSVIKSYDDGVDPVCRYCTESDPLLKALHVKTLRDAAMSGMLGAPEVFQIGQNFIRLINAKKALDVGTFTGASAVAWALALPEDGRVLSMDVTHEYLDVCRELINEKRDVAKKIDFRKASALKTLDALIVDGEAGTWDFAFIDADKDNYSNYYDRLVTLLRPRGVLLIDNVSSSNRENVSQALWAGEVVSPTTPSAMAIDAANRLVEEDSRTDNALVNVADGLHIVFKR